MHIEAGIVQGAKIALSYGTAIGSFMAIAWQISNYQGSKLSLIPKSLITTLLVLCFFEVLPHQAVGVSEVHLILASTLFLIFGLIPTAIGLSLGLLTQGVFFAPFDLPQYGMNVTTLLVPLFVMSYISKSLIQNQQAYRDIKYTTALKLSLTYQAGVVSWVGFWVFYGEGFSNYEGVITFASSYIGVVVIEPILDLMALAIAKNFKSFDYSLSKLHITKR